MYSKKVYDKRWKKANPDKVSAQNKRYAINNEEKLAKYQEKYKSRRCQLQRERRRKRPYRALAVQLKTKFSITVATYNKMMSLQLGRCPICDIVLTGEGTTGPHIDHDHSSGKFRGILCATHNMMLGLVGDDPYLLRRAAEYLEKR